MYKRQIYTCVYSAPSGGGGSSTATYAVSTPSGVKHGSVSVSHKNASKGTAVTITVKPDSGYELDDLTVTDQSGDAVKLTKKSDTQYTFTMPASKVEITVSFVEEPALTTLPFQMCIRDSRREQRQILQHDPQSRHAGWRGRDRRRADH